MTQDALITLRPCPNEKVPAPIRPYRHSINVQTRFNDFDMLGHLNNSVYFQFMDLAKIRYFEAVTGAPLDYSGITLVIVNINISFFSVSLPDEQLSVATACIKISQRSFIIEQRIYNPETGDVKCVATTVMAAFNPASRKSTFLEPSWANALTSFEHLDEETKS